ncbi:uncharacterized protein LOC116174634 [Photinus pyralis]|nr:uncharacterized protein LOC116174634 [Photinus pyralis]
MTCSISEGTLKQYNATYKLWWSFCLKHQIPVWDATTSHVLKFLTYVQTNKKLKYGSINSHKSALALILNTDLSNNILLKRYLKGVYRRNPPTRKYNSTWNPQPLLDYISNMAEPLDLKSLSQKLVTLLALTTAGRLQTISLIRISGIVESPQKIQIFISDRIKTSSLNKKQPCLQLPFFNEKPTLCVASALKKYIQLTNNIRKVEQDFLFLTAKAPHNLASKQTLSRWVKELLKKAGIDTSMFQAHSTRHSASSAALRQGLSLETICRTVGWSESSQTFGKFYNRPLIDDTAFAKSIINLTPL